MYTCEWCPIRYRKFSHRTILKIWPLNRLNLDLSFSGLNLEIHVSHSWTRYIGEESQSHENKVKGQVPNLGQGYQKETRRNITTNANNVTNYEIASTTDAGLSISSVTIETEEPGNHTLGAATNKSLGNVTLPIQTINKTMPENRVISMSLYGHNPRYVNGAIENAKLVNKVYPGWKLRIYLPAKKKIQNGRGLQVPSFIVDELKSLNVDLVFMDTISTKVKPMMWRFLVANDVTVDRFIVRDADSRLISRDATEVERWIQSGEAFHCIRDHPGHTGWPISGGLWGAVPSKLRSILKNNTFEQMTNFSAQFFEDMEFLRNVVWPQVKNNTYCSDSYTCKKWASSHPFATNRSENFEFVGEVILGNGQRRPGDLGTMKKNPGSEKCRPS